MSLLAEIRSSTRALFARVRGGLGPRTPWLWFGLFALLVCWEYTTPTPERAPTERPEAHGDGLYYYAYLRSIVFDHDVELNNDYRLLGDQFGHGIHPLTGRAKNVFPIGPAIAWLPLVPFAHAGQALAEALGAPPDQLDGTESLYQRSVLFGSVLAGLLTTALGIWLARQITDRGLATLAAIGVCLGSPLIWYMLKQPSFSHAVDSGACALFASAWLVSYGSRAYARWIGLGLLLGFAMLVRPQNVTHAILPFGEWLLMCSPLVRARRGRELGAAIASGFAFVLAAITMIAPLLLIWRRMYGAWTLVPQGGHFMMWGDSRMEAPLFASRGGLFAFHPLLLFAVVGLFALAALPRFGRRLRLFALLGLLVFILQTYINGSALDWWGGWAFGGRRFLSCTLYFMAGLAALLELVRAFVVRHTRGFVQFVAATVLLAFALYNRSLIDDFIHARMPPDGMQPMKPRIAGALNKTVDEVYAITGNPGSWPANWIFAIRGRTSPERYDLAAGNDMLESELIPGRGFGFDDYHALGGFGPASDFGGRPARKVGGKRATWMFVLRKRAQLKGEVLLASPHRGTRVQMFLSGTKILDARPTTAWKPYPLRIPREVASTGANYVRIVQRLPRPGAYVAYGGAGLSIVPEPVPAVPATP